MERVTLGKTAHEVRKLKGYRLRVSKGNDKGKALTIDAPRVSIGAHTTNALTLTDPAVSGHHFELLVESAGVRLHDLGSKNGTYVSGVRVFDVLLEPKMKVEVGDTQLVLEAAGADIEVPASDRESFGPLLGKSVPMRELFAQLERIAASESTVLVQGETGTGKEVVAEALIQAGPRAKGPLVVVDCGSLAPTLVESALFGHEKGAFTGATAAYPGAFERAAGGTVLLDELGELPLELQPKLLRVLERREVQRLGGQKPMAVDVRIIAATHRPLEEAVNQGRFRADLFYRLSVLVLRVPPLRDRLDDVPLLAHGFLAQLPGASPAVLTEAVLARFTSYRWPGNVRELRNAVERLAAGAEPLVAGAPAPALAGDAGAADAPVDLDTPFRVQKERLVHAFERRYAQALLDSSKGNMSAAARRARIDRVAVLKLLQRHGLG